MWIWQNCLRGVARSLNMACDMMLSRLMTLCQLCWPASQDTVVWCGCRAPSQSSGGTLKSEVSQNRRSDGRIERRGWSDAIEPGQYGNRGTPQSIDQWPAMHRQSNRIPMTRCDGRLPATAWQIFGNIQEIYCIDAYSSSACDMSPPVSLDWSVDFDQCTVHSRNEGGSLQNGSQETVASYVELATKTQLRSTASS